mgnify:CR=1 FL=1
MENVNDIKNSKEYSDFREYQEFRKFKAEQWKSARSKAQFTDDAKIQPQDKEIEDAVLGALMLERDAYAIVCDLLRPESFYDPGNQKIYAAINKLGVMQQPIDMLTVTQQLRADGALDDVGAALFVEEGDQRLAHASSVMTVAASNSGLARMVSAAVLTAFWSRGVKARRACCTRLPSWPSTVSGTSSGFWVTK